MFRELHIQRQSNDIVRGKSKELVYLGTKKWEISLEKRFSYANLENMIRISFTHFLENCIRRIWYPIHSIEFLREDFRYEIITFPGSESIGNSISLDKFKRIIGDHLTLSIGWLLSCILRKKIERYRAYKKREENKGISKSKKYFLLVFSWSEKEKSN
jgi:hypothetical protein